MNIHEMIKYFSSFVQGNERKAVSTSKQVDSQILT